MARNTLTSRIVGDISRLSALDAQHILDTPPESGFEDVVRLATRLCAAPVALVSFVAADRQWFKARLGFPRCETDLDSSVCKFVLGEPDILVIPDLTRDGRTRGNPLVTGEPFIRFYAGVPLRAPGGEVLGSLCVIDTAPRPAGLTADQADDLRALARQVESLLEMRRAVETRDEVLHRQRVELRRAQRIDVLAKASQALLTATDPAAVLAPILSGNADALGFDRSFTYDVWPDGRHLRLTHSLNAGAQASLQRMPFGMPVCGIVAERRAPLILRDVQDGRDPEYQAARDLGVNAYAGFPIVSRDALRGVIAFASTREAAFDEEALSFLETLVRLISAAYERLDDEAALARAGERLRLAVDATRIGIFDYDLVEGELSWDARTRELFGVGPTAPVSYDGSFLPALHPDDRDAADAAVRAAIDPAGVGAFDVEYRVRPLDGGPEAWLAARGQAVVEGGRTVRFVGTVRDITSRRRAEGALRSTEERYRLAGRATNDAIWDWDLLTNHVGWNDAIRATYGHAPETVEPTGDWWIAHIHPDDRDRVSHGIHEVIDGTGTAWADDYRFRRGDGCFADVVDRGFVIRDGSGRGIRMIGAMLDITARKAGERRNAALVELGDRLREAATSLDVVEAAAEILSRTLSVSRAGYARIDLADDLLEVEGDRVAGDMPSLRGRVPLLPFAETVARARDGRALVLSDVEAAEGFDRPGYRGIGTRAQIKVPVLNRGNLVGLLFAHEREPRQWTSEEVAFAQGVADRTYAALTRIDAEADQRILNEELSHRLKNTLAMVLSIATQTLRSVPDRAPVEAFEQRIHALSSAHDVLLRKSWTAAPARDVVRTVLKGAGHGDRIDVSGPDLDLGPRATLSLSLVLHELATNAAKYGALSVPAGRVTIGWSLEGGGEDGEVRLDWTERGGPEPVEPAGTGRTGFGSRLIRMGLVGTGGVELRYPPLGFEATMRAPLNQLQRS